MKLYEVIGKYYGYWILDTGKADPVYKSGGEAAWGTAHRDYLDEHLGPGVSYKEVFDKGWVRIVHVDVTMFIHNIQNATPAARWGTQDVLKQYKDTLKEVVIEDYQTLRGIPPRPANQAIQYIKSLG